MDDFSKRQDLNYLAEQFQSTSDADKAQQFIRCSAAQRADYLWRLRGAAREDILSPRKRAALWHVERRLTALDAQMRASGK
jgi:hypothetical protein